ncbi:iron complex outermembrane receptor protein [Methylorubrum rhodinum]|uniref:Iron complex outermembrane receptor protein n=1 Tax=Methylorubrum rhodinum TaxID=29428 RepID=A0A840ZQ24_9HYPH|nr:TonB-dependent receptor [Methylorubrum rhodinum]MBB5759706.1 iron complex outermembrane receptor protein [Methylorubrum rhodinum]
MPAPLRRRRAALCLLAAQPLALPLAAQAAPESVTLEELSVAGEGRGNGSGGAPPNGKKFGVAAPPGAAALPIEQPVGQIVTAVGREAIANRPATSIGSVLLDSPGVTVRQGNGGRDVVISIRGNNARSTGVTRNMVVLEDGFPVTQADGASRFDLVDPRAYSRIDVFRGPQSALFGNYATGGALAFRTRTGREINGYEYGIDVGSYGYLSNYFTVGGASGPFEVSLFASDVRGNGYQQHASYDTQTVNLLASYTPTPDNRFTLKVINNEIDANIPGRSSLRDFTLNPYQRRCDTADTAALGCAKFPLGGIPATAAQAGFRRNDRRTIVAGRWEHDIDAQTTWRVQVGFDERNYNQPFYTSSGRGSLPSYNVLTDLTRRGEFLGLPAIGYVALSYSAVDVTASTYNLTPFGGARLGSLVALQDAVQSNLGGRARLELELSPEWTAVTGISAENSTISGRNRSFSIDTLTGALVTTPSFADRRFLNVAPELALVYRPDPTWALRGRVATGYATPSFSSLFITSTGDPGNNTGLKTQENLGFDLGADWLPVEGLRLSLTGFYEFFRNEFVSQSPGAGLSNYTFNAPASEHRGIELAATYAFAPGWNGVLAYTFDDQVYIDYVEQLSVRRVAPELPAGFENVTRPFNRAGNRIPGVPDHQLLARLGYDVPTGPLAGLGGFAEVVAQGGYYADNSNLLKVPGYAIVNLNLHYSALLPDGYAKRIDLYGEVRNVLDTVYVASANPLANTLNRDTGLLNGRGALASTVGSIYAGAPRTFVAGMKLSF